MEALPEEVAKMKEKNLSSKIGKIIGRLVTSATVLAPISLTVGASDPEGIVEETIRTEINDNEDVRIMQVGWRKLEKIGITWIKMVFCKQVG